MALSLLLLLAAGLVTLTSLLLLIASDWRLSLAALGLQYVGIFIFISQEWSLVMAATRLLAGWMAAAVLGMALLSLPQPAPRRSDPEAPAGTRRRAARSAALNSALSGARRLHAWLDLSPGPVFYGLAALLVGLAALTQLPRLRAWLPQLSPAQAWGSQILIFLGLIKAAYATHPLHTTLGLLSLFSGFEVLYAAINDTPLTAGLSAAVCLGLALVGAYLIVAPYMEPNE